MTSKKMNQDALIDELLENCHGSKDILGKKDLVKAVVDLCSNLPADEYSSEHSSAIIDVLSDFIHRRRTV